RGARSARGGGVSRLARRRGRAGSGKGSALGLCPARLRPSERGRRAGRSRRTAMKIGMITDSLGELSFDELLDTAAGLGIERLEFAAGNWSKAPHLALDRMLDSAAERREFTAKL